MSNAGENIYLYGDLTMAMYNAVVTGIQLALMLALYYLIVAYG